MLDYSDWPNEDYKEVAQKIQEDLKLTDEEVSKLRQITIDYENGVVEGNDMDEYDKAFIKGVVNSTTVSRRVRYAGAVFLVGIWAPYLDAETLWELTVEYTSAFFNSNHE